MGIKDETQFCDQGQDLIVDKGGLRTQLPRSTGTDGLEVESEEVGGVYRNTVKIEVYKNKAEIGGEREQIGVCSGVRGTSTTLANNVTIT